MRSVNSFAPARAPDGDDGAEEEVGEKVVLRVHEEPDAVGADVRHRGDHAGRIGVAQEDGRVEPEHRHRQQHAQYPGSPGAWWSRPHGHGQAGHLSGPGPIAGDQPREEGERHRSADRNGDDEQPRLAERRADDGHRHLADAQHA